MAERPDDASDSRATRLAVVILRRILIVFGMLAVGVAVGAIVAAAGAGAAAETLASGAALPAPPAQTASADWWLQGALLGGVALLLRRVL